MPTQAQRKIRNKEYYDRNKERERARAKVRHKTHKEEENSKARLYYSEHKEIILQTSVEYRKRYRIENRDKINAQQKIYHEKHKEEASLYRKQYFSKNKEKLYADRREYDRKLRKEVIEHYGNKCACCGETENHFLCMDHINGGGNKHRKELGHRYIYQWLRQNNYPEGFQVLCFNCNLAKGFYGVCPHEEKRHLTEGK